MKRLFETLVVFALTLCVWAGFAYVVATLAAFLLGEETVEYVVGGAAVLGLLVAIGVASRLVGRGITRYL